jgi:hypothetical protein
MRARKQVSTVLGPHGRAADYPPRAAAGPQFTQTPYEMVVRSIEYIFRTFWQLLSDFLATVADSFSPFETLSVFLSEPNSNVCNAQNQFQFVDNDQFDLLEIAHETKHNEQLGQRCTTNRFPKIYIIYDFDTC